MRASGFVCVIFVRESAALFADQNNGVTRESERERVK